MLPFPRDFFKAVVGDMLEEHHLDVEFRCIHVGALPTKQLWFGSLSDMEERWPEIQHLTQKKYDIYFTAVPRLPRAAEGKKEHALPPKLIVGSVWADLDVGKKKPYPNLTTALRRVLKADVTRAELRPSILIVLTTISTAREEGAERSVLTPADPWRSCESFVLLFRGAVGYTCEHQEPRYEGSLGCLTSSPTLTSRSGLRESRATGSKRIGATSIS